MRSSPRAAKAYRCAASAAILAAVLTVPWLAGCDTDAMAPPAVTAVEVRAPETRLAIGARVQLTAAARDANGRVVTGEPVAWASSDTLAATVDANGLVTARAPGTVRIRASAAGVGGEVTLTVLVPVAAVRIDPVPFYVLLVGDVLEVRPDALDSAGQVLTGRAFAFASSNPYTVAVTAGGMLHALQAGVATLTASSEGKHDSVFLNVMPFNVSWTGIGLALNCTTMTTGTTCRAPAILRTAGFPSGMTNLIGHCVTTYESRNPGVVDVTPVPYQWCQAAELRALAPGEADIVATYVAPNGRRWVSSPLTVRVR